MKLVIFYGEDLALSSWWSSLAGKISVYGIMDLVEDTATDAKRVIGTSTFGMNFYLLSLYWIIFLRLNPEVWRFSYFRIRRENCNGTLFTSPLDESSVYASRLNSVGFGALLEWLA